jgi:hypothetical protein
MGILSAADAAFLRGAVQIAFDKTVEVLAPATTARTGLRETGKQTLSTLRTVSGRLTQANFNRFFEGQVLTETEYNFVFPYDADLTGMFYLRIQGDSQLYEPVNTNLTVSDRVETIVTVQAVEQP